MPNRLPILPAHIESTVRSIAELHAQHDQRTTMLQRIVDRTTAWVGRPAFIGVLTAFVLSWVLGNLVISWSGQEPWDPPPFAWLASVLSLMALYMTVLILATQRHDDELASHREQLTLELAILSEQKSAKIIELLEELRRDSPHLANRHDAEAGAMSKPADPQAVLEAVVDTHAEMLTSEAAEREAAARPAST
jgi:uncharacterized membrane protein